MKNTPTIEAVVPNPFVAPEAAISAGNGASTIKVHNAYGDIDAYLTILVIALSVILPALGGVMIYRTYRNTKIKGITRTRRFVNGGGLIFLGIFSPIVINWMVALVRDVNLCGNMF